jgi:hypothetical protein
VSAAAVGAVRDTDDPSLCAEELGVEEAEDHVGDQYPERDLQEQLRGVLVAQAALEAGAQRRSQAGRQQGGRSASSTQLPDTKARTRWKEALNGGGGLGVDALILNLVKPHARERQGSTLTLLLTCCCLMPPQCQHWRWRPTQLPKD